MKNTIKSVTSNLLLMIALGLSVTLSATVVKAQAQDLDPDIITLGTDVFASGDSLSLGGNEGNLFAAGTSVSIRESAGGIYVLGQNISINDGAAGSIFALGQSVTSSGDVGGSSYFAGDTLDLNHTQSAGTLFAGGSTISIDINAANNVYLGGESVTIAGTYQGDVFVGATNMTVQPGTVISGELKYATEGEASIPDDINATKVSQTEMSANYASEFTGYEHKDRSVLEKAVDALVSVLVVTILGTLTFLLFRGQATATASWLRNAPLQSVVMSFVGFSILVGATAAVALEILVLSAGLTWFFMVLLVLVPIVALASGIVALLAYFFGLHAVVALGRNYWSNLLPTDLDRWPGQAVMLLLGSVVLGIIGIVWSGLGMVLTFIILMLGLGVLALRLLKGQAPA